MVAEKKEHKKKKSKLTKYSIILLVLLVAGSLIALGSGTPSCWIRPPQSIIACFNDTIWQLIGFEVQLANTTNYSLRVGPLLVDVPGDHVEIDNYLDAEQVLVNGSPVLTEYSDTDSHVAGDPPYLYNDSSTMYFNESKMNQTIEIIANSTDADTDSHVAGDPPYLYNDSSTMYFNESKINQTISVKINIANITCQPQCIGRRFVSSVYTGCSFMTIG